MKRGLILFIFFACMSGLLSACGSGSNPAQLSLGITPASLPDATVNVPYSQTVSIMASGAIIQSDPMK